MPISVKNFQKPPLRGYNESSLKTSLKSSAPSRSQTRLSQIVQFIPTILRSLLPLMLQQSPRLTRPVYSREFTNTPTLPSSPPCLSSGTTRTSHSPSAESGSTASTSSTRVGTSLTYSEIAPIYAQPRSHGLHCATGRRKTGST